MVSCWAGTGLEGSGKIATLGRAYGKAGMQESFSSLTAPAGEPEPEAKTHPGQGETAAPDTDVCLPPLEGNVAWAPARDQGPEENSAALQGEPALPAPAPPRRGPELALATAPGQFPKPPSARSPPFLQVPAPLAPQNPNHLLPLPKFTLLPFS